MATTTGTYAAPFLQPFGEMLTNYAAGQLTQPQDISGLLPQVAGQNVLQQQALQQGATQAGLGALQFNQQGELTGAGQGTGIAGYQPFLQGAAQLAGPQGYQQYMSPYQQDVINTTLANYDIQAQKGLAPLAANAIQSGAFGGAREGIQRAEYQSASDRNRAALEAQLRQQGFGQAQNQANIGFGQQTSLASLQPALAGSNIQMLQGLGGQQQNYQQGILNALQQGAAIQNQYPLQKLSGIASLFGNIAQATPATPGQPITTNPYLSGAQAFASIYGPYMQSQATQNALLIRSGIDPKTGRPFGQGDTGGTGGGIIDWGIRTAGDWLKNLGGTGFPSGPWDNTQEYPVGNNPDEWGWTGGDVTGDWGSF
jgi:hypothetical protein